jgi:phenylalanyl-tRNA synthetase beta chain
VKNLLSSDGFNEIMTISMTSAQRAGIVSEETSVVSLLNPLSTELNVMRPEMFLTGLESVSYNMNRQQHDLKLFESGKTYSRTEKVTVKKTTWSYILPEIKICIAGIRLQLQLTSST